MGSYYNKTLYKFSININIINPADVTIDKVRFDFYGSSFNRNYTYKLNIIEIPQVKLYENPNEKEIAKALKDEEEKILKHIEKGIVIAMCIEGKQYSSEEFANILNTSEPITFIIGSSHGLSDTVKQKANLKLSFSKMTFPHRMFRVMLLEQIYRGANILKGTPYHK